MSHFPNTVIYMNLVMYLIRVSEEEPEQQVRLKFIVSPLVGLKAIKSEHSCWVAELRLSPTSRCRASGCRSCETSYPPAWHLCRLSSPWQHGGEARKGEGVPVNKEWGKQRKGRVGNEEKRNRDWFWTSHQGLSISDSGLSGEHFSVSLLLAPLPIRPCYEESSLVTTMAVHWRHLATCGIQWSGSGQSGRF